MKTFRRPQFWLLPTTLLVLATAASMAQADEPLVKAEDDGPVSVAHILDKKVTGPIRVKIHVRDWVQFRGASAGPREPQLLVLNDTKVGEQRLDVLVYHEVFDRLQALGIKDAKGHFEGKTIVLSGKVERAPTPDGGTAVIIWVRDLDQIESIQE